MTTSQARALKCTFLKQGDVLVARMPDPLGRACIYPGDAKPAVTVVDICIIRPGETGPDPRWLVHWFNSQNTRNQITAFTTGTTRSRISRGNLAKLKLPVLPIAEQQRIAEILDRADALRVKRRDALAQLDALAQSIFVDMFGDPATNPYGWDVSPLSDLGIEFRYGTSNKSSANGRFALRIPNIVGSVINLRDLKRVPVTDEEFDRLRLQRGDLLFVRTNGNPDYVGRCVVYDPDEVRNRGLDGDDFIFASYLIRGRISHDAISPIFLREWLATREGRRRLRRQSKTSAGQYNLNTQGLGSIRVIVPPPELQEEFARRLRTATVVRRITETTSAKLDALFASLQHRAFRGEL